MRTQKEIQEKIEQLKKTGSDPMQVQRKHLIRKLEWKNVRWYMKPEIWLDSQNEKKWKETSRVDVEYLKKEMHDFMYGAYDFFIEKDAIGCLVSAQYLIIWLWLLGKKEESFLAHILHRFTGHNTNFCKPIFDDICNHYGWRIKKFYQEWESKSNLILPNKGGKTDSMFVKDIEKVDPLAQLLEEHENI